MDFIRQWLLGVVACAMLVSVAGQLCPEGGVRQIARFTGGLLLLCAMLRPLATVELPDGLWGSGYREAVAALELELGAEREKALVDGIAAELQAYIEDKADSLGADVRSEVSMEVRGGVPTVTRVTLRGAYSAALAESIAAELGVTKEKQIWIDS